ncbi:MAG: Gldg family protein, partial [Sediminibacterium sp.]
MPQLLKHKYGWLGLLVILVAVIYLSANIGYRADLTADKRYSLTNPTKQLLSTLDSTIQVDVFLTGELPADYKKLSLATQELL